MQPTNPMTRYIRLGQLLALVIALVPTPSTDAFAQKWRGITEAENKIVFSGSDLDEYRAVHYYHPLDEDDSQERYRVRWTAGLRRLPVFQVDLFVLPPSRHFPTSRKTRLDRYARALAWFKNKPFSTIDSGTARTALGPAEFLIFTADKHRCGLFQLYFDDGTISHPDTLGNTHLIGLYCPVSAQVDAGALESLLSGVGLRGIAVPSVEEPRGDGPAVSRRPSKDPLAKLVASGDIKGLRRAAARDRDPDTVIAFRHPRFAGGRVIRRPILMAAALFGRTEMVVFLLKQGASTRGRSSGAICAAIAMEHPQIVDVLIRKDPKLKDYDRCGRSGVLFPIELAKRLNLHDIVDKLLGSHSP